MWLPQLLINSKYNTQLHSIWFIIGKNCKALSFELFDIKNIQFYSHYIFCSFWKFLEKVDYSTITKGSTLPVWQIQGRGIVFIYSTRIPFFRRLFKNWFLKSLHLSITVKPIHENNFIGNQYRQIIMKKNHFIEKEKQIPKRKSNKKMSHNHSFFVSIPKS